MSTTPLPTEDELRDDLRELWSHGFNAPIDWHQDAARMDRDKIIEGILAKVDSLRAEVARLQAEHERMVDDGR